MEIAQEVLDKLIQYIEGASPVIWQAMLKQVTVEAVLKFGVLALVFLALAITLGITAKIAWKHSDEVKYGDDDWIGGAIFATVGTVFSAGLFLIFLSGMVMRLLNPTYYAILGILELVK